MAAVSKIVRDVMASAPKRATFVGIEQTLVGTERLAPGEKRGGTKLVYGDHTVCDVVVMGFDYENLCRRSADMLEAVEADGSLILSDKAVLDSITAKGRKAWTGRGDKAVESTVTITDVQTARAELLESLRKSEKDENESTTDHVFEPLMDKAGEPIIGGRVYIGGGDPTDLRAPVPGTIYLQGLRVQHTVKVAAVNGPKPESQSNPVTVAKDTLRYLLPVGRYVSYRLTPKGDWKLSIGGTAVLESTTLGFILTDELYETLRAA